MSNWSLLLGYPYVLDSDHMALSPGDHSRAGCPPEDTQWYPSQSPLITLFSHISVSTAAKVLFENQHLIVSLPWLKKNTVISPNS